MQSWRRVKVGYDRPRAELIATRIVGWAGQTDPVSRGPGLTQDDAVQYVTDLAFYRHFVAMGPTRVQWAIFRKSSGTLLRTVWVTEFPGYDNKTELALPMVGEEPIQSPRKESDELGANWGAQLALALDGVIHSIARAEQAGSVPTGYGAEFPGGAEPTPGSMQPYVGAGVVAIIVGGAAVAVIGSVALWRYLDPEVRIRAATTRAAAQAYALRLETMAETGQDIPPSPIEKANAAAVRDAAKKPRNRAWGYGAAAVGGIAGGGIGMAALQRKVSG